MLTQRPTLSDIKDARIRTESVVRNTPILTSEYFNDLLGIELFFKCENFQKTGSFKLRGALNKLLSLSDHEKSKGVIAVSTGNHGKGVAYAASLLGVKSTIYMSSMVPEYRKLAIEALGANVEIVGQNSDEADLYARNISEKENITLIHLSLIHISEPTRPY